MQIQLESFIGENKELEERLQMAVKDRRVMGTLLQEIEEENEKALGRIDLLENEVRFSPKISSIHHDANSM